jgi:adenosylhomocysteine nucleosidase
LLLFIAAERRELDGVLANADRVKKLGWPIAFAGMAWLHGEAVLLVANGPGPKLAGQAVEIAKEHTELKGLVSTGFCGALNPALEACDIFVATEVADARLALSLPHFHSCDRPASTLPCKTGRLLSLDRVVSTAAEKAEFRKTGADAVDMEAAAVAEKAGQWNLPLYCIRVVTDTASESFPLDFNQMRDSNGRFSRARILAAALRRPAVVMPGLLKLNRRTKSAAKALGDFIVHARF